MGRLPLLFAFLVAAPLLAQDSSDPVAQAISQGDLYQSKRKYDLALDAYHKADKLSHHNSAQTYLKLAAVERKLGDFSSALDDAKKAVKVAGDDKSVAVRARLLRATLLSQMAGKSTDKKLREAEDEIRQALALDSANALARYDLGFVLLVSESAPGIDKKAFSSAVPSGSRSCFGEWSPIPCARVRPSRRTSLSPLARIRAFRTTPSAAKWSLWIFGAPGARPAVNPFPLSAI